MSNNNRIFYACQGVAIGSEGLGTYAVANMVHGVQSVGITTNFNLEQAFELGQIEIYENIEGTPDVEITLEKVLDGYPLMYHMASTGVTGTSASGLVARSKQKCDLRLGIFDESNNAIEICNFFKKAVLPSVDINSSQYLLQMPDVWDVIFYNVEGPGYQNYFQKKIIFLKKSNFIKHSRR